MRKINIFGHGSYIGTTGYNEHTREFFRALSNYANVKFRNFSVGNSWSGYNLEPHNNEPYINDVDKKILYQQILFNKDDSRSDYVIYPEEFKNFHQDLNIVLCETYHHVFYDKYVGPKIAYNVWESTLQPEDFFNKLKEFDELWVPSKWQKEVTIKQGYPEDKIRVVPEGVNIDLFFPENVKHNLTSDGRFKFFLVGRWDYRKSTLEIIKAFLESFDKSEPVDLIVSIDNPFSNDGLKNTKERLDFYGLNDSRIKILNFPSKEEYISILKSCNVFLSCARSEGWNLPLIEAMACGIPSIYSNCSGQLEFAEGLGLPVKIIGELPASNSYYNHFNKIVGNYYEPDFEDLKDKIRESYQNFEYYKNKALNESIIIAENFNWDRVAKNAILEIQDFLIKNQNNKKNDDNKIYISYIDGPRVEIIGDYNTEYYVEFIDKSTGHIFYSGVIHNNMWIACGIKYYVPWQIKINNQIYDEFSLENQNVLISIESKSLGDNIAWVPYAVDFGKKHNCNVILSTFYNSFFEGLPEYNDVKFVTPGSTVNCKTVYKIGWFKKDGKWDDTDRNKNQVNLIPLQQTATDVLGLDFYELNYGINVKNENISFNKPYFVFAPNSTAGCKEWPYEYWPILAKLLNEIGYDVISITKNKFNIPNTKNIWGKSLNYVANILQNASGFVGLGSGLSWLNWALNKHTYMINGFSKDGHEFSTNITKIYNDNCIFCWNHETFVFDAGDWDWCPIYKGTNKQHICQKSIQPIQVFNEIIKSLNQ
jgi:autotransporter strand-loop-strand O-heptosyltransferase